MAGLYDASSKIKLSGYVELVEGSSIAQLI